MKKLASKDTKELLSEEEIRERSLSKSEFSQSWKGRMTFFDIDKSQIAKKIGVKKKGEFAIKV
jgi:RNA polymerase subunit RPABC4/transcription elongation factor Spt4